MLPEKGKVFPGTAVTAVSFTETSRPTKCAIFIAPSSMFEVRATPILPSYVKGLRSSGYHQPQPPRYTILRADSGRSVPNVSFRAENRRYSRGR